MAGPGWFEGEKWHSARWPQGADLRGKRVAVVGTGSTSAQLVPAIAEDVAQLYVFQRQPGWLMPKLERDLTAEERAKLMRPLYHRKVRMQQWWMYEKGLGRALIEGTKANVKAQQACVGYIEKSLADRPDLVKMVTPDYPFGGKRPMKDSNFYPTLMRDNVELVPHAVTEVTPHGIIDDTGVERDIDVLVMCTGFTPATFLATMDVVGRDGVSLHDFWGGRLPGLPGPDGAGLPQLLHALRSQHQHGRDAHARTPGPVRERQHQAHDPRRRHRHRGAPLRWPTPSTGTSSANCPRPWSTSTPTCTTTGGRRPGATSSPGARA